MKKPPSKNIGQTINPAELIADMSEEKLVALHNTIVNRLNMWFCRKGRPGNSRNG